MGHDGQAAVLLRLGIAPRLVERIVDIQVLDALDLDVDARQADTVRRVTCLTALLRRPAHFVAHRPAKAGKLQLAGLALGLAFCHALTFLWLAPLNIKHCEVLRSRSMMRPEYVPASSSLLRLVVTMIGSILL